MKRKYTVVLLYPDYYAATFGHDVEVVVVTVNTGRNLRVSLEEAARLAREKVVRMFNVAASGEAFRDGADLAVVAVFQGAARLAATADDAL